MIVDAKKYQSLLKATGGGAFSRLEFENQGVIIRIIHVKQMTGYIRMYFNQDRDQIVSGRRFEPLRGDPFRMNEREFYKFYTNLEFVKPIPEELTAMVVVRDELSDLFLVTAAPFKAGFKGQVMFVAQTTQRTEMESNVTLASLMFFEDVSKMTPKASEPKSGRVSTKRKKNETKSDSD